MYTHSFTHTHTFVNKDSYQALSPPLKGPTYKSMCSSIAALSTLQEIGLCSPKVCVIKCLRVDFSRISLAPRSHPAGRWVAPHVPRLRIALLSEKIAPHPSLELVTKFTEYHGRLNFNLCLKFTCSLVSTSDAYHCTSRTFFILSTI